MINLDIYSIRLILPLPCIYLTISLYLIAQSYPVSSNGTSESQINKAHLSNGSNFSTREDKRDFTQTQTHGPASIAGPNQNGILSRAPNGSRNIPRSLDNDYLNAAAAGFLMADSSDMKLNLNDAIDRNLSNLLGRVGPDMRPSRDYHDFQDITLNVSIRAWDLLHEHASAAIGHNIDAAWSKYQWLLLEAGASSKCQTSIEATMLGAKRMESWAVKIFNSWGSFPMNGIFDGTYGDMGSYDSCINIERNKYIDHAHYCAVNFRPVMPSIKDYELIIRKEPDILRYHFETRDARPGDGSSLGGNASGVRERDAFTDLLDHAQYHHYVYYKLGTCWPIGCSPFDVQRLMRLVSRRSILMNGPVKCFSKNESDYEEPDDVLASSDQGNTTARRGRLVISTQDKNNGIFIWKPHLYKAHKVALAIIAVITGFILFMTFVDICVNRIPLLFKVIATSLRGLPLDSSVGGRHRACYHAAPQTMTSDFVVCRDALSKQQQHQQRQQATSIGQMHPTKLEFSLIASDADEADTGDRQVEPTDWMIRGQSEPSLFMSVVDDFSIVTNVAQFFRVSANQMRTDVLCLNGIRCITMAWIIMAHTMQHNDWTQFGRTRSIEISLNSIVNQLLFNASHSVDTFFLMSGLLSALAAFRYSQGISAKFNSFAFIIGRWLRLTPQILFVSMIFIVVPTLSSGPHWYSMVGEFSESCMENWWINVLHLQAFYKKEEMCNFVTWWISIDFFYHFFALAIIWIIMLMGHRSGFLSIMSLIASSVVYQSYRHYTEGMPPTMMSTVPLMGAMWTKMVLDFTWWPYTHTIPFFSGFYLGYLMAMKKELIVAQLNTRRALIGWSVSVSLLVAQSFSIYWWITGQASYSRIVSTLFHNVSLFVWSGSLCWIIIACQHGYGGFVNRFLSWKVFIVLGKASYLVYLSHFQVLFLFFGNQRLLLEPSTINMLYMVLGNIILSTLNGILLCTVYEIPWLKMHRRLMKYV